VLLTREMNPHDMNRRQDWKFLISDPQRRETALRESVIPRSTPSRLQLKTSQRFDPATLPSEAVLDESATEWDMTRVRSRGGDTFQLYLREIGQVKLLTPDEEIALAERIKLGDQEAREHMIKANLRLVVKIAHEYEELGLPLMDLVSEGNIGLMKAIERFDPRKGAKLSTYASWWIKQSIKRALAHQSRTIRLPEHAVDKVAVIRRAETALYETYGRLPTDEELAEHLGIRDVRPVRRYRDASKRPVELDAPIGTDSETESISEIVADTNAAAPFDHLVKANDLALAREVFETLDERESTILVLRFGLDNKPSKTLEKIGQKFGVTRERIRQLEGLALKKLRAAMQRRDTPNSTGDNGGGQNPGPIDCPIDVLSRQQIRSEKERYSKS
jgi:RNA polymerase primary sigma factor